MTATVIDLKTGEVLAEGKRPNPAEYRYTLMQAMEMLQSTLQMRPDCRQQGLQTCINHTCLSVEGAAALLGMATHIEQKMQQAVMYAQQVRQS